MSSSIAASLTTKVVYETLSMVGKLSISVGKDIGTVFYNTLANFPDATINNITGGDSTFCFKLIENGKSAILGAAKSAHGVAFDYVFPNAKDAEFSGAEIVGPGVAGALLALLFVEHGTKATHAAGSLLNKAVRVFFPEQEKKLEDSATYKEHTSNTTLFKRLAFSTLITLVSGYGASLLYQEAKPRLDAAGLSTQTQGMIAAVGLATYFLIKYGSCLLPKQLPVEPLSNGSKKSLIQKDSPNDIEPISDKESASSLAIPPAPTLGSLIDSLVGPNGSHLEKFKLSWQYSNSMPLSKSGSLNDSLSSIGSSSPVFSTKKSSKLSKTDYQQTLGSLGGDSASSLPSLISAGGN